MNTNQIITAILAAVIGIAFLLVVAAPYAHVEIPPETTSIVYALVGGLVGVGGKSILDNMAQARAEAKAAEKVYK